MRPGREVVDCLGVIQRVDARPGRWGTEKKISQKAGQAQSRLPPEP